MEYYEVVSVCTKRKSCREKLREQKERRKEKAGNMFTNMCYSAMFVVALFI